jgi:lipid-binding SYLF domain-containing protein
MNFHLHFTFRRLSFLTVASAVHQLHTICPSLHISCVDNNPNTPQLTGQTFARPDAGRKEDAMVLHSYVPGIHRFRLGFALVTLATAVALLVNGPRLDAVTKSKVEDRLDNSAMVMKEAMGIRSGIPRDLLQKAYCVIVIPSVMKGAFIFGGSYGRGVMSCRAGNDLKGPWTAPTMMALEGGSFGLQLGGQATDFVLLVMNERGARTILGAKAKIGGDITGAAGPVGRSAQANLDLYLRTAILTYSRSRGLFGGVSLEGSTLRPDNKANEGLYGKKVSARSIVLENAVPIPAPAEKLISRLNEYSQKASPEKTAELPPGSPPLATSKQHRIVEVYSFDEGQYVRS